MTDEDLTLEEMLDIQREFEENFFHPDHMTLDERNEWMESFVTHLMDQSTSLLNELNWKEHERREPVEYDQVLQELVDIGKYWVSMMVVLNVDPVEFAEVYVERSKEVEERYEREMQ